MIGIASAGFGVENFLESPQCGCGLDCGNGGVSEVKNILGTSTYPREHEQLKKLIDATSEKYGQIAEMSVTADEGMFLSLLLKLMNAKRTLEIGVFTGYSLLSTALALPDDGQAVAVDCDREAYETGLPFIRNAGVEHKINFIHKNGISALDEMLAKGEEEKMFDFVFIDADKPNYLRYHEQVLKLVKTGGIIAYDNALWFGSVAEGFDWPEVTEHFLAIRKAIMEHNEKLASDPRVEISQISIGDGVTLCRRRVILIFNGYIGGQC